MTIDRRGILAAGAAWVTIPAIGRAQALRTIRLGVLTDMAGPYGDLAGPGSVQAVRQAVQDAAGLGLRVEVVSADHQNRPDVASNVARQWFDRDGVDAIVDVPASSAALAVAGIAREKNRVFLASSPGTVDLTGPQCSPHPVHWTCDTWMLANSTGAAVVRAGGDSWFFITVDYAFGHSVEAETTRFVQAAGGRVMGSARFPFPGTSDFSAFLLRAQASRAKVVALACGGADMINAVKQAAEFGLVRGGQRIAGLLVFITNIQALGLPVTQGLIATTSFYWDATDRTREWHARFAAAHQGRAATMVQAGTYSAVRHYLRAVEAAGTDDAERVAAMMRRMPVQDMYNDNVRIREDGRVLHDMLLVQVKTPEDSRGPWDTYTILTRIPGAEAFRPLSQGECPLLRR